MAHLRERSTNSWTLLLKSVFYTAVTTDRAYSALYRLILLHLELARLSDRSPSLTTKRRQQFWPWPAACHIINLLNR